MNILNALILGVLQGFTEFLPVSSSGHLVLAQSLIKNFQQPGVLFDVILHLGTFGAVLVYFRKYILEIKKKYLAYLALATLPVVLVGFTFQELVEKLFMNSQIVAFALILTGIMNYFTDKLGRKNKKINFKKAFFIGIFQALAIIPGISRSGSTIFSGVWQGINRKRAAEFSFLLSVPAVAGASVFQLIKYQQSLESSLMVYALGFFSALVTGYLAIRVVFIVLNKNSFRYFAYYCFLVGIISLLALQV